MAYPLALYRSAALTDRAVSTTQFRSEIQQASAAGHDLTDLRARQRVAMDMPKWLVPLPRLMGVGILALVSAIVVYVGLIRAVL